MNNLGSLGLNSSQSAEGEVHQTGFQQLGHIIDQSAERAAFLIKQWLYSEDLPTRELLTVIPRQLGLEQLNRVLSLLNQEDRKRWKPP